ncbi:MAG: iron ABC transporter permease [Deltaproteobacteria bacterium]|nr:iron ABC transporter permease [Deltaproteobacteria bacterium]
MPHLVSHLTLIRIFRVCLLLLAFLAGVSALSLVAGPAPIGMTAVFKGMLAAIHVPGVSDPLTGAERTILFSIRIPRILLAGLVGAALSCAGVVFQGLLRNPLADPYVLGVSGGAAVGAILAIVTGIGSLPFGIPGLAFTGGLLSILLVWGLSGGTGGRRTDRTLLAGIIVNAFFSALIMFLVSITSGEQLRSVIFWLMGDLAMAGENDILLAAVFLVAGFAVMYLHARDLNILLTGEETARQLGIPVKRTRMLLLISASLVTGAAVSVSGIIGFVGLMVPHIVRMLFGSDHRLLLPASLLFGGAFLMAADTIARIVLAPAELPIGVVTALCGAPYFAYLMKRSA